MLSTHTGEIIKYFIIFSINTVIFSNLFRLHSEKVKQLVSSLNTTRELVGISVAVKAITLTRLVEVLTTGVTTSADKEELLEVVKAAEVMGIEFEGYQIMKKKDQIKSTKNETVRENTDTLEREYSNKLDEENTNEEGEIVDECETKKPGKKRGRPKGTTKQSLTLKCDACAQTFCKKTELNKHM